MSEENKRAAQHAQENARRAADDYDDEGLPAASRAREHGVQDAPAGSEREADDER